MTFRSFWILSLIALVCSTAIKSFAAQHSTANVHNRISDLNDRIAQHNAHLAFQENVGYLTSVLQELNIPPESQLVVFSPTSSQARLINEENPRAIYFNDDVSVGWVRGGEALEIAAHDPDEGVVFYT